MASRSDDERVLNQMKKLLPILLLLLILCGCGNNNEEKTADYCLLINEQIKQYDFHIAKIEQGKIVLYGKNLSVLKKLISPVTIKALIYPISKNTKTESFSQQAPALTIHAVL